MCSHPFSALRRVVYKVEYSDLGRHRDWSSQLAPYSYSNSVPTNKAIISPSLPSRRKCESLPSKHTSYSTHNTKPVNFSRKRTDPVHTERVLSCVVLQVSERFVHKTRTLRLDARGCTRLALQHHTPLWQTAWVQSGT